MESLNIKRKVQGQVNKYKIKMALSVEQFTSPGKYETDLHFEKVQKILEIPNQIFGDLTKKYYVPKKNQIKYNKEKN